MHLRTPSLVTGAAVLSVGLLSAVPPCFASSPQKTEIQDILDDLEGLRFDEFIDASYKQVLSVPGFRILGSSIALPRFVTFLTF